MTTSFEDAVTKYQTTFAGSRRPLRNQFYLTTVVLLGMGAILSSAGAGVTTNLNRFLIYLGLAVLASGATVRLPHLNGAISLNTLFILMSISDLTVAQTMIVATVAAVVQQLWQTRQKTEPAQLLFHISTIALGVFLSTKFLHLQWLQAAFEGAAGFALAACVYFLMTTVPAAVRCGLMEGKPVYSVWWADYAWSFPYYLMTATLVSLSHALALVFNWQTTGLMLPVVYVIYRAYRLNVSQLGAEKKYAEQMAGLHLRTIEALALAIEAKDHTTNDHLHRVQVYAQHIGKELGLPENELRALEAAALLHDIGKLAVPEHIISKPGRLTPEEFEKMKIHPVIGAEILEAVQFPYPVVPIVAAHHERFDGTGYPEGLSGEQIPIGARILAAVDCLDALASDRQYRRALPLQEAMRLVKAQSGTAFDPQVVEILESAYTELERAAKARSGAKAKLSTHVKIANGAAPAAGFAEQTALPESLTPVRKRGDALSSIAAARHEVHMLFEMSQLLGTSLSLVDTLSMLAKRLQGVVPHDTFAILLKRENNLHPEYVTGVDSAALSALSMPIGEGLSGWVAENSKPVLNGNPAVEPGYLNDANTFTTLRSALSVPLESISGTIGVLSLYSNEKEAFTQDHVRILLAISSKLALSIENSLRFRQAEDNATVDFLTGLPNGRSLFVHVEQEVKRCQERSRPLVVLVCDLDGFKNVNDTFGHLEGNRMLRKAAAIFRRNSRPSDYVARMGGDEFVIVMPDIQGTDLPPILERMRMAIRQASTEEYGEPLLNVSIGFAELTPETTQAEQLLSEADRQMYKVKRIHKQEDPACKPFTSSPCPTTYLVQ